MKHILFIPLLIITETISTQACQCVPHSITQEIEHSDQIFIGTILKKTTSDQAYYFVSISKMFKGDLADTLTIHTGFGGGDCGMVFEVGKSYLVYSYLKETSRCRRNSLVETSMDIIKLRFIFQPDFRSKIATGKDALINISEAEYLNSIFRYEKGDGFNFNEKRVAFIKDNLVLSKLQYFETCGGKDVIQRLLILTPEEKTKASAFDAIIILDRNKKIGKRVRNKLIKILT